MIIWLGATRRGRSWSREIDICIVHATWLVLFWTKLTFNWFNTGKFVMIFYVIVQKLVTKNCVCGVVGIKSLHSQRKLQSMKSYHSLIASWRLENIQRNCSTNTTIQNHRTLLIHSVNDDSIGVRYKKKSYQISTLGR